MKKVTIYYLHDYGDIGMQTVITGPYADYAIAKEKSIKSGWYGGDKVIKEEEAYQDVDGKLYKKLGLPLELKEEKKKKLKNSITSKLTPEEIEFIKNNKI